MTDNNILLLKSFAKYIKENYTLGIYYGGMFSSEFCECDPTPEYLVEKFIRKSSTDKEGSVEEQKLKLVINLL